MAIKKLWRPKPPKQPKPPVNPALDALRLKRGEIKETEVTNPKVLELARTTPYSELERMAESRLWTKQALKPMEFNRTPIAEPLPRKEIPIEIRAEMKSLEGLSLEELRKRLKKLLEEIGQGD